MSGIRVRPATLADVDAVRRVGQETWPAAYAFAGDDYITEGLATWWSRQAVARGIETTRTFVLESGGEVVGIGNIDLRGDRPVIWKLYVLPEHQGTGGGRALVARVLEEAPGGSEVLLEYVEGNERAAAFYRHIGFEELHREVSERADRPARVWMRVRT